MVLALPHLATTMPPHLHPLLLDTIMAHTVIMDEVVTVLEVAAAADVVVEVASVVSLRSVALAD